MQFGKIQCFKINMKTYSISLKLYCTLMAIKLPTETILLNNRRILKCTAVKKYSKEIIVS